MIQRVQSLLLLLVAAFSVLLIYLPVYERLPLTTNPDVTGTPVGISRSAILVIINAATGILAFLAIFFFKNRRMQIRMCNLGILITCVFVALLFFMADTMSGDERIHYLVGSYLPLLQLLFLFIASRFIKRDEDLVRSADRLR